MTLAAVIGLEVHARLAMERKLFCGCQQAPLDPPNTRICEVCSGQPGSLPVLDPEAVRLAVLAADTLGATVNAVSRFDRKHYFHPDLPKGYQVTQLFEPIASGGSIRLATGKLVKLERMHLEEDAGRSVLDAHDVRIDLNRAGTGLLEFVTEPVLRSAEEAVEFLVSLRDRLRFAGVSEANLEAGSFRCDVNLSMHQPGEPFGAKVELKNLNSFRHVADAIEYELARQAAALSAGREVAEETRGYDPESGRTFAQRRKERGHDYRVFPDPNLAPVRLDEPTLAAWRAAAPPTKADRRASVEALADLAPQSVEFLLEEPARVAWFLRACQADEATSPQATASWMANELRGAGADDRVYDALDPGDFGELVRRVEAETLERRHAKTILERWCAASASGDVSAAIADLGLPKALEDDELTALCREAIEADPNAMASIRSGSSRAIGALVGAVLKRAGDAAAPKRVRQRLEELIAPAQESESPVEDHSSQDVVPIESLIDLELLRRDGRDPSPARIRAALPRGWVLEPDGRHARRDLRLFFREGWILMVGLLVFGSVGGAFLWGALPRGWQGVTRFVVMIIVLLFVGGLLAPAITRALHSGSSRRD